MPKAGCYNLILYGGYSSVAERRSVAPDVVGSTPTSRPNHTAAGLTLYPIWPWVDRQECYPSNLARRLYPSSCRVQLWIAPGFSRLAPGLRVLASSVWTEFSSWKSIKGSWGDVLPRKL